LVHRTVGLITSKTSVEVSGSVFLFAHVHVRVDETVY
jgi:hypothetical protein